MHGLPNFSIRDLVTLNDSISIACSLRPLAKLVRPIRNAENIESLLVTEYVPELRRSVLRSPESGPVGLMYTAISQKSSHESK